MIPFSARHFTAALLSAASAVAGAEAPPAAVPDEANVDHAAIIQSWKDAALARGEKLYTTVCITCHGTPENAGSLPNSRAFWKEPFRNGNDPFSIFQTITKGVGQMPPWPKLNPQQR